MARCLEIIDVCIWRMFVFLPVVVIVRGSVGMFVVSRPLLMIVFFWQVYVCARGVMDAVCSVCIVTRGAVGARVLEL